ncbi:MAG: guanylate kinase [Bacilli bacterium]|nr:guanylate kinase [Bacilli bacterium]
MIKTNNNGLLIVISGPSGTGKGTIIKEIVKDNANMWLSISTTTRDMRPGDIKDETYFFITKEQFEEKIKNDDFLEYAIVHHNQYYGTNKEDVLKRLNKGYDVILEIDINGASQIKQKYPEAIFIFILPPSMEELRKRLTARKTESKEKVIERFKAAYKEINEITKYNYVVVNDEVQIAVNKIKSILTAEKCRVDRIEEVYLNTPEEIMHEDLADIN